MNIFGKWQIHDILTFDEKQNERHITADEIRAMEENEENADYKAMLNMVIVVSPETMNTYISVPEERIAEAEAEGLEITEYGALIECRRVEEKDGAYFYDSGIDGEVGEEKVSPLLKLELDEEGFLVAGGGAFRLKKADV